MTNPKLFKKTSVGAWVSICTLNNTERFCGAQQLEKKVEKIKFNIIHTHCNGGEKKDRHLLCTVLLKNEGEMLEILRMHFSKVNIQEK